MIDAARDELATNRRHTAPRLSDVGQFDSNRHRPGLDLGDDCLVAIRVSGPLRRRHMAREARARLFLHAAGLRQFDLREQHLSDRDVRHTGPITRHI